MNIEKRIIDWNRKRNGLHLDIQLEIAMLTEEANEFFMSETLTNMLREWADFMFVWTGTKAKWMAKSPGRVQVQAFLDKQEWFYALEKWVDRVHAQMMDLLEKEIRKVSKYGGMYGILDGALEAVVSANENKSAEKDANGKVIKGPDYIAPDRVIEELLYES